MHEINEVVEATTTQDVMPREKLQQSSAEALSIAELLAIIFSTGIKNKNAKESVLALASRLVQEYGSLGLRDITTLKDMQDATGLPNVKSCQLVAVMELGRRLFGDPCKHVSQRPIRSPADVAERVKDMRELRKEQLRGLYLNVRNHVIHEEVISLGTITANLVAPADVFRPALHYTAVSVIVVHNHPSGDTSPSKEDIAVTTQLSQAGTLLGITLLDHIIIAGDTHLSLKEYGIL